MSPLPNRILFRKLLSQPKVRGTPESVDMNVTAEKYLLPISISEPLDHYHHKLVMEMADFYPM